MSGLDEILGQMGHNPADVGFGDLCLLCDRAFGEPQQATSGYRRYRTPWPDDPQVNIQNKKGKAGAYQVRQVLKAVERLQAEHGAEE